MIPVPTPSFVALKKTNLCNRKVEACDASTTVVDKRAYKRSKIILEKV
jgi:hypothetical protein